MEVDKYTVNSVPEAYDIAEKLGAVSMAEYSDGIYGYNKITAEISLKESDNFKIYIVKRFDNMIFYLVIYKTTSLYGVLNNLSMCINTGDIVNVSVNTKDKTIIHNNNCIPLKYYCPTLPGIYHYMNSLIEYADKNTEKYQKRKSEIWSIKGETGKNPLKVEIKAGLTKEKLNSMRLKAQMTGEQIFDVDINTILIPFSNSYVDLICTMQPEVFEYYLIPVDLGKAIDEHNILDIEHIRNYRVKDIPSSLYKKYLYYEMITEEIDNKEKLRRTQALQRAAKVMKMTVQ